MTRTLLLAEQPFAGLRSAAILEEVRASLGAEGPILVPGAADPPQGFEAVAPDADPVALGIAHVVLAGVFSDRAALEGALGLAARALATGARIEARSLSLERAAAQRDPPAHVEALEEAAALELRDHHSANTLLVWRIAAPFRIFAYPERAVWPDPTLAEALPAGPLLGVGILGGGGPAGALARSGTALRALLAPFRGWPVVPLPAEPPGGRGDDLGGTRAFAATWLEGASVLLPELSDPAFRRSLDASRLAGLVARCAHVVTNQDLVAALAVAQRVPVLGLGAGQDARIKACLATLANELPPGSALVQPMRDPA